MLHTVLRLSLWLQLQLDIPIVNGLRFLSRALAGWL
jgi:hypothetical protein